MILVTTQTLSDIFVPVLPPTEDGHRVSDRFAKLHTAQGGVCPLCGREIREDQLGSVHHWIPASDRWGSNADWNLYAVHHACNMVASNNPPTVGIRSECKNIADAQLLDNGGICVDCGKPTSRMHALRCRDCAAVQNRVASSAGHTAIRSDDARRKAQNARIQKSAARRYREDPSLRQRRLDASAKWHATHRLKCDFVGIPRSSSAKELKKYWTPEIDTTFMEQ